MKYQEALEYINEKNKLGSRLGLDSIIKLLELLGNPQNKLKCIHIGGTNGKGSTSSYLSYALESAGYKVGLFTSPHLNKINESIQINHQEISDEIFGRLIGRIKEKADIMVGEGLFHPTTFEIITALCFLYFVEEDIDICILEVGLGGRNDSTNIISSPIASVITTIDYDHIDILGSTLSEIAYEKAGIIKNNSIVVSYPQKKEAIEVIEKVAKEKNADFHICPMDNVIVKDVNKNGSKFDFSFEDRYLEDINISMLGEYQVYNACLALTTLLILRNKGLIEITEKQLREGLMEARLPGRLEVLKNNPTLLIDGAHNVQGITQLKKAISLFKYNRLILCIGILKDKDISHMVELLAPLADEIIVTEVNSPRRLAAEALAKEIFKYNKNIIIEKDAKKVIEKALEFSEQDDLILFAGSLYLIGEIRSLFKLL
jgi:dihydrofolate synthase/folylpolyglutamate synthase